MEWAVAGCARVVRTRILPRLLPGTAAAIAIGVFVPLHPVILVVLAGLAYVGLAFLCRAVPPELLNAALRRDPPPAA